jgi:hypothetical protein
MKLNEILNSKVDIEVVAEKPKEFTTRAKIGDQTIEFTAFKSFKEGFEVMFGQPMGKQGELFLGKTNKGDELAIFSMVKESLLMFIKKYEPNIIQFSAEKDMDGSDNRSSLYVRLIERFKVPGYTFDKQAFNKHTNFKLTKDGFDATQ